VPCGQRSRAVDQAEQLSDDAVARCAAVEREDASHEPAASHLRERSRAQPARSAATARAARDDATGCVEWL
jgi:hypothetical protein